MSLRFSFKLRTILLLVAAVALCCAWGRRLIPQCDHAVSLQQTFRGAFENYIVENGAVRSSASNSEDGHRFYVEFQLQPYARAWVRRGFSASIIDLGSGTTVGEGEIATIGERTLPVESWGKRFAYYPVKVTITFLFQSRIHEGQQVEVRIPVQKQNDAHQVPLDAFVQIRGNFFVIVRKGWNRAPRRLHVKAHNTRNAVIDESLSDPLPVGACVITNPGKSCDLTALERHVYGTERIDGALPQRLRLTHDCLSCYWRTRWKALLDRLRSPFNR